MLVLRHRMKCSSRLRKILCRCCTRSIIQLYVYIVTYGMSPAASELFQSAVLMFGGNALVPTKFEVLMAALVEDMPLLLGE